MTCWKIGSTACGTSVSGIAMKSYFIVVTQPKGLSVTSTLGSTTAPASSLLDLNKAQLGFEQDHRLRWGDDFGRLSIELLLDRELAAGMPLIRFGEIGLATNELIADRHTESRTSREQFLNYMSMNIGKAAINAIVSYGELGMVD